jgi:hypothetical protein
LLAHFGLIAIKISIFGFFKTEKKTSQIVVVNQKTNPGSIYILNWRSWRANKPFENKKTKQKKTFISSWLYLAPDFSNPLIFIRTRILFDTFPFALATSVSGMIISLFLLLFVPARMHPKSVWIPSFKRYPHGLWMTTDDEPIKERTMRRWIQKFDGCLFEFLKPYELDFLVFDDWRD